MEYCLSQAGGSRLEIGVVTTKAASVIHHAHLNLYYLTLILNIKKQCLCGAFKELRDFGHLNLFKQDSL